MSTSDWNAAVYLSFGNERLRPALDLLAQVPIERPELVYDLGCGPGTATIHLKRRWPEARVIGVDGSPDMLARARAEHDDIEWVEADLNAWQPDAPGDVVYSNATFQWLDDHHSLLPRVVEAVKPGGVLAIQVPNNWREPSHVSMAETAKNGPWRDRVVPILRELPVLMPHEYYAILRPLVSYLNIWETTYHQLLEGDDPIVAWTSGSSLRPLLDPLNEEERAAFVEGIPPPSNPPLPQAGRRPHHLPLQAHLHGSSALTRSQEPP